MSLAAQNCLVGSQTLLFAQQQQGENFFGHRFRTVEILSLEYLKSFGQTKYSFMAIIIY